MYAWQFYGVDQPLKRADSIPAPEPAPNQVLIEVRAAGSCHTDVGVLHDPMLTYTVTNWPIVPGHETAGVITRIGSEVTDFAVGDRVAVWSMGDSHGFAESGGFGSEVRASTTSLVRLPDNVSFGYGAAATDAGMTPYHALVGRGGVRPATRSASSDSAASARSPPRS